MGGALIAPCQKALSAPLIFSFPKPTRRIFSASLSEGTGSSVEQRPRTEEEGGQPRKLRVDHAEQQRRYKRRRKVYEQLSRGPRQGSREVRGRGDGGVAADQRMSGAPAGECGLCAGARSYAGSGAAHAAGAPVNSAEEKDEVW
ncbi:hypothetical protein Syun_001571 [Stephania yunnanensis]|uniref:Uncharacterized protein n=1 Tax=Stephania yunnanensis TaxID=152371 RepID=A0AAP0LE63_9MAGN